MRRFVFFLFLLAGLTPAFALGPLPFEELLYKGRAVPFYGAANTPQQDQILDMIKQSHLAERMAQLTQSTTRIKRDLGIGFQSCGGPNAFYSHDKSSIVFCLEMVELMMKLAKADTEMTMKLNRTEFSKTLDGAIWGIFFHEMGHAVIDINRVPITGREEDVADQFAVYYALNFIEPRDIPVIIPTIWFFQLLAKNTDIASSNHDDIKHLMSNEHSLNDQRVYNLACWALGSNSSRGAAAANLVGLPRDRGARCQGEYASLDYGMKTRFKKYFKH